MIKFDFIYKNFQIILVSLLPIALLTGPAIPDCIISICGFLFLIKTFYFKEYDIFKNKLFIIILIFSAYLIFVSLLSNNLLLSFENSLFYFRFVIFALTISSLIQNDNKLFFYLLLSFLFIYSLVIFDSYYQYFTEKNLFGFEYDGQRLSGLFKEEKILGSYIARLTPFFLGIVFYLYQDSKKIVISSLFLVLLLDVLVILSGERSSIFYLLFSTFLISILISKWKIYRLSAFIISFIISFIIIILNESVKERVINKTLDQTNLFGEKINFFSVQHQVIYYSSFKIFKDYPIFGIGPKNFREVCKNEKYYSYTLEDQSVNGCQSHSHNTYVQLLTETGVIGFSFVFVFFSYIIIILLRQFYYLYFKKKAYLEDYKLCFYVAILISLWPFVPTGSFFNNWLNVIYFLPIGFIINDYK